MTVTVKWNNATFQFSLPPPETKLAAIREGIATYTELPYDGFSIIYDGAVMVDDNAPISAYYLRPNSTITVVSHQNNLHREGKNKATNPTEQAMIATIQAELSSIDATLVPSHSSFLSQLRPPASSPTTLSKEKARLSELLLQSLMRLDAIIPERDWTTARSQRKAAVLHIQNLLDEIDDAWSRWNHV